MAGDKGYKIGGRGKLFNYHLKTPLNSNIKDSFKKFSLLFRQAEMVFVITWFLNHFTLEYIPSMNSIWIITPVSLLHDWVTQSEPSLIFFKLSILIA